MLSGFFVLPKVFVCWDGLLCSLIVCLPRNEKIMYIVITHSPAYKICFSCNYSLALNLNLKNWIMNVIVMLNLFSVYPCTYF